jgi:NAD(P)-dependent dehydrogenase (short-subunit alcohol dehydrogenase family)
MAVERKYALITGSSRGIGRGIALKLAEAGTHVAINYVKNEAAANDTLAQIRKRGGDGFLVQADISKTAELHRMFAAVKSRFGKLDIFVANARPEVPEFYRPPMEIGLEHWAAAMDSQATSFLVSIREAAEMMNDGGRVIAITYAPGGMYGSWQPWVAMGAAKSAMEVLCRYFAVALAQRGITVNAISPGWVEDSVLNSLPESVQHSIRDWNVNGWTPMGRLGTPADIGNAVALLCSEQASFITGQLIAVDGGASLMNPLMPLEIQQAPRPVARAKTA